VIARLLTLCLIAPTAQTPAAAAPSVPTKRGVIFVVDGIGGMDLLCASAQLAFPRKGVPHEVRPFPWSHGTGQLFLDLFDRPHLLRKSRELTDEVNAVLAKDPSTPVFLIGRSGGAALVIHTAELLPPNSLERIVLLSTGLSSGYDLRPALRAVRGPIVSFHSKNDQLVLNWGTRTFGTLDRVRSPAAGLNGFVPPKDLDDEGRALYARLVQIPWRARMLYVGHAGNHLGTAMPLFLAAEVAPWLK
jgi:pimeloyl-ACP methyl ester carboxylesterase